jgi:hypothetical protein
MQLNLSWSQLVVITTVYAQQQARVRLASRKQLLQPRPQTVSVTRVMQGDSSAMLETKQRAQRAQKANTSQVQDTLCVLCASQEHTKTAKVKLRAWTVCPANTSTGWGLMIAKTARPINTRSFLSPRTVRCAIVTVMLVRSTLVALQQAQDHASNVFLGASKTRPVCMLVKHVARALIRTKLA